MASSKEYLDFILEQLSEKAITQQIEKKGCVVFRSEAKVDFTDNINIKNIKKTDIPTATKYILESQLRYPMIM